MADATQLIDTKKFHLDIENINREFRAIALANNWEAYHNPKNLAAAVSVEAGELLAEFQWLTEAESCSLDAAQKSRVADEIADITMYLIELSRSLDINMVDAVNTKIETNKQRFKAR
jgi:NTP pyrophosphatase (non-canonical NTP hydrolase)